MKTIFLVTVITLVSVLASAQDFNYVCRGKDRQNRNVMIQIVDVTPRNQAIMANVTVTVGAETKLYSKVTVYGSSEEGFDYGITTDDFMFWITNPPNMLGGDNIAGSYFTGRSYALKYRRIFKCEKL